MSRIAHLLSGIAIAATTLGLTTPAQAQQTIECRSNNYGYNECYAGDLSSPQLIHQTSSSACIVNRSWGFNPRQGYIWVNEGCSGVFADVGGYHHGRGDTWDQGARHYDDRGHDAGAIVGGMVLGAMLGAAARDDHDAHRHARDRRSEEIDTRPQFDRDGNPNFDVHGNYQGCHGLGCQVDNPDR
ncbi:DUF3011 domain-containing protein [Dokdonella sp.]|uniref:DUF3011 domain-containing protein n=1 Tax=Dokdonella sp. TaxID=2291710 RepID=UPI0025C38316|nr:DUF3011 domain-containing protein [Dokdonella sp.]MBX3693432.1 DUF3011 domain-containing protein [Dokdonella sp.]